ncbi:hypothetical protein HK102_007953, partial [Quaeritorhiza haematococci]
QLPRFQSVPAPAPVPAPTSPAVAPAPAPPAVPSPAPSLGPSPSVSPGARSDPTNASNASPSPALLPNTTSGTLVANSTAPNNPSANPSPSFIVQIIGNQAPPSGNSGDSSSSSPEPTETDSESPSTSSYAIIVAASVLVVVFGIIFISCMLRYLLQQRRKRSKPHRGSNIFASNTTDSFEAIGDSKNKFKKSSGRGWWDRLVDDYDSSEYSASPTSTSPPLKHPKAALSRFDSVSSAVSSNATLALFNAPVDSHGLIIPRPVSSIRSIQIPPTQEGRISTPLPSADANATPNANEISNARLSLYTASVVDRPRSGTVVTDVSISTDADAATAVQVPPAADYKPPTVNLDEEDIPMGIPVRVFPDPRLVAEPSALQQQFDISGQTSSSQTSLPIGSNNAFSTSPPKRAAAATAAAPGPSSSFPPIIPSADTESFLPPYTSRPASPFVSSPRSGKFG